MVRECGVAGLRRGAGETVGSKGVLRGCVESALPNVEPTDGSVKNGLRNPVPCEMKKGCGIFILQGKIPKHDAFWNLNLPFCHILPSPEFNRIYLDSSCVVC